MANILDPMDLKQILTLHIDGLSNRRIAVILGISRNTVNTYIKLFSASDYPFTSFLELDNAALAELFYSYTTWIFWSKLTPAIWTKKKSPSAFRGC